MVLTGPTGVGKTEAAVSFCSRHGWDIISADSRQVYRGMDIGTAKPSPSERSAVTFHLLDVVDPGTVFSAADFARAALDIAKRLMREARRFMFVGGSAFYLRALFRPFFRAPAASKELRQRLSEQSLDVLYGRLQQLDPVRAAEVHPNDRQRIVRALEVCELTGRRFSELKQEGVESGVLTPVYVVLNLPRAELYRRINDRFDRMMQAGLLAEVQRLRDSGFGYGTYVANAYGYSELLAYLDGRMRLEQAVELAKAKTRAYARRQLTWFRSLTDAYWIEAIDRVAMQRRLEAIAIESLE